MVFIDERRMNILSPKALEWNIKSNEEKTINTEEIFEILHYQSTDVTNNKYSV